MTSETFSRSRIDELGSRLRARVTDPDLRLLDAYRKSFREDYDFVVEALRTRIGLELSGRPAKSTAAIVDKLKRGSMRLSQMQDIAGCRTTAVDITAQDTMVSAIAKIFPATIIDRRGQPSHGYRAVHVIARPNVLPIEIQVRTRLQHLWAEISEKLADQFGIEVKYGGGPDIARQSLESMRDIVKRFEMLEAKHITFRTENTKGEMEEMRNEIQQMLTRFAELNKR